MAIASEDTMEESGVVTTHTREFGPTGLIFQLGSSEIMGMETTVELHPSALDARGSVIVLQALDLEGVKGFLGQVFSQASGFTPSNMELTSLDVQATGDNAAGFKIQVETAIADFDAYFLFFARDRISAQVFAFGRTDRIVLEDVIDLAGLMDARIAETLARPATLERGALPGGGPHAYPH